MEMERMKIIFAYLMRSRRVWVPVEEIEKALADIDEFRETKP